MTLNITAWVDNSLNAIVMLNILDVNEYYFRSLDIQVSNIQVYI